MIDLGLNLPEGRAPRLLFIGAHCDDIEIGCGGTVIELLRAWPSAQVHWVVLSSGPVREREARRAAKLLLKGTHAHVDVRNFRESHFPAQFVELKACFEEIKKAASPDVVFTHAREELHQDHRTVGELTWNAFRNHLVLEYEIPKYDGGLGSPSVFMPLRPATVRRKVSLLMKVFETQLSRQWFTPSTFEALMRLRGIECNAPSGFAEAFYARKLVLGCP